MEKKALPKSVTKVRLALRFLQLKLNRPGHIRQRDKMKMWAKCREYKAILKAHKKICHKNQKAGAKKRRKKKLKPFCSESEMKRAIRSEKIIIKKLHGRQWRRWEKDKPELMAKLHLIHKRMLLTWKIHPDKRKFSVDSRFEKEDMPWTDKTE